MTTRAGGTWAGLCCVLALGAAGCGVSDPYADRSRTGEATSPAPREPVGRTEPARERQAGRPARAEALLERFALKYGNWSYRQLPQARRELAGLATGELRKHLLDEAQQVADDVALRASTARSSGSVEAVALRDDRPALVVTRETAHGDSGAVDSGYFVYLARVEHTSAGWRVAEWKPTR